MIRSLIGKIRRQPKAVRNNIAFGIAGTFTACVFMVWAYQLPSRLSEVTEVTGGAEEVGIFSQIFDQLGEQVATVKESFPDNAVEEGEENPLDSLVAEYRASSTSSTTALFSIASSTAATTTDVTIQPRIVRIVTTTTSTTSSSTESSQ